jgi:hypothetical protein
MKFFAGSKLYKYEYLICYIENCQVATFVRLEYQKQEHFVRHVNYAMNLLSYVTVFRLKDWTFAFASLFVINNVYTIATGS